MPFLLLIRHGQTQWNKEEVFRGSVDVPLSSFGLKEAQKLAEALEPYPLKTIYTSPLSRALETAQTIAGRMGMEPVVLSELRDMDFGPWQGKSLSQVVKEYPALWDTWRVAPHKLLLPGGESLKKVLVRGKKALEVVLRDAPGDATVAMVSHRVVLKVLLLALLKLPLACFWQFKIDTCSLNLVKVEDGRGSLVLFNDRCHLGDMKGEAGERRDF